MQPLHLVRTIVLVECSLIETVKWMATNRDGVVGLMKVIIPSKNDDDTDTGNLPASDVRALAIDRNQLWIGTIKGF
jgi:hypothetical protein